MRALPETAAVFQKGLVALHVSPHLLPGRLTPHDWYAIMGAGETPSTSTLES